MSHLVPGPPGTSGAAAAESDSGLGDQSWDVIAVIFAGGLGSRMDGSHDRPKQFVEVGGKPILAHTLERFQDHPAVSAIYVSTLAEYVDHVQDIGRGHGVQKLRRVVPGGSSAHASILAALRAAVDDGAADRAVTLIHDGVRPIVNSDLLDRNIESVRRTGSAITAIPAFETVASANTHTGVVDYVTDRNAMHMLQAPQAFLLGEIYDVNVLAERDGLVGQFVDQAQMMAHYGHKLHTVLGMRGNVKLTVPLDIIFFAHLVDSGQYARILDGGSW